MGDRKLSEPEPVGVEDIARRTGQQPVTIRKWRDRHDTFPPPRWTVSGRPAWDWQLDIVPWLHATGREHMAG